jgi:cell division protein ZapA (FtsZ GTPase activity inhibitor)
MTEVSLKVLLAGRTYPLVVKKEEEEGVLLAVKWINEKVKEFEQNYSVRDKQDLIAMAALNLLSTQLNASQKTLAGDKELINQLDLFVSDYLQKQA